MRADQLERMRAVQERMAEVFFEEADTANWTGSGKASKDMTREERGDRYWCKKNATASLALVVRIENLLALRDGRASGGPTPNQESDDEANLEKEVQSAEREARELARRVVDQAAGRATTRAKARS
jgi:hypothetical protein